MGGRRAARCQSAAALRRRRAKEKEGTSFPREGEALSALPLPAGLAALPGGIRRAARPALGEAAGRRLLALYRHLPPPPAPVWRRGPRRRRRARVYVCLPGAAAAGRGARQVVTASMAVAAPGGR